MDRNELSTEESERSGNTVTRILSLVVKHGDYHL